MTEQKDHADLKRLVQQGYDRVAREYARLEGEHEWPRQRWLDKLLNRLEAGSAVLDLGCGSGDPADIVIARQHRVTGVDISKAQIELARQNVPDGIFLHADAGSVEFPEASFDAVVSFYSLEHLPRQEHAVILKRCQSWLKPGGHLLIGLEAGDYEGLVGEWLGVPMYMSSYDPETMIGLVRQSGFEILETAIETQLEGENEVPYLWLLARNTDVDE